MISEREIKDKQAYQWSFGKNQFGELGLGVTKNALVPAYAIGIKDVSTKMIATSSSHSVLVCGGGRAYFAGSKLHGKMGVKANTKPVPKFTLMTALSNHRVKMVACNDYTTMCLLEDSSVVQLGGTKGDYEPRQIASLSGILVT